MSDENNCCVDKFFTMIGYIILGSILVCGLMIIGSCVGL